MTARGPLPDPRRRAEALQRRRRTVRDRLARERRQALEAAGQLPLDLAPAEPEAAGDYVPGEELFD